MKPLTEIMKEEWNDVIREERADAANDTSKKTAQRMIVDGKLGLGDIAKYTGLPLSEVEKLAGTAQM